MSFLRYCLLGYLIAIVCLLTHSLLTTTSCRLLAAVAKEQAACWGSLLAAVAKSRRDLCSLGCVSPAYSSVGSVPLLYAHYPSLHLAVFLCSTPLCCIYIHQCSQLMDSKSTAPVLLRDITYSHPNSSACRRSRGLCMSVTCGTI